MRAWPFGWSLFATATYIKGHWHCTGGASLREPVAVPLDKVPQPPGEFHAQALHVVRAVDVRRGGPRGGDSITRVADPLAGVGVCDPLTCPTVSLWQADFCDPYGHARSAAQVAHTQGSLLAPLNAKKSQIPNCQMLRNQHVCSMRTRRSTWCNHYGGSH